MNDMSSVIVPKSDQINADDLIAGPKTITIRDVQIRGGQEQPVSIYFDGSDKAFRPCKSMSRVLVQGWGPDAKNYIGRSLTLYRDPTVKWAGMEVGGIRISHMSHIDGEKLMMLTATKGSRKPFKVLPLSVEPQSDKAADGAAALIARIEASDDVASILAEPTVAKQIAWLRDKRPELAARIDVAVQAKAPADPFSNESPSYADVTEQTAQDIDGPLDQQANETPGDMPQWMKREQAIRDLIDVAETMADWRKADQAFQNVAASLPDGVRNGLDAILTDRLKQLRAQEG